MKRFEVNMSNNKKAVIIKGMEIPKNCFKCDFRDGLTCIAADQKEIYKFRAIRKRDNFCPMIEVDADDIVSRKGLLEEYDRQHVGPPGGARKIIEKAPSAIEGEKADSQSIYLEKTESRLDDSIKDPTKDPEFTKSCLQDRREIEPIAYFADDVSYRLNAATTHTYNFELMSLGVPHEEIDKFGKERP